MNPCLDQIGQAVSCFLEFISPDSGLNRVERQCLDKIQEKQEKDLQTLKPHLFRFADLILETAAKNNITGILVDGANARFVGLFAYNLLSADQSIHCRFLTIPSETKLGLNEALGQKIELISDDLGERPLLVTDLIATGCYSAAICQELTRLGGEPSVVSLLYDSIMEKGGSFHRVEEAGALSVEAVLDFRDTSLGAIYKNAPLNGVVSQQSPCGTKRTLPWVMDTS